MYLFLQNKKIAISGFHVQRKIHDCTLVQPQKVTMEKNTNTNEKTSLHGIFRKITKLTDFITSSNLLDVPHFKFLPFSVYKSKGNDEMRLSISCWLGSA